MFSSLCTVIFDFRCGWLGSLHFNWPRQYIQYTFFVIDKEKILELKSKLKMAVERIKELVIEREKLINSGNRLRAELAEIKGI